MLAGGFDLVEPVNLRRIQSGTAQEIGHAGDGVERGADFMAHVGDKAAFRQIGGFGGFLGRLQFGRSSIHQFLKVVTIVDQCQFALAAGGNVLARGENTDKPACFIANDHVVPGHQQRIALCVQNAVLEMVQRRLLTLDQCLEILANRLAISLRQKVVEPVHADQAIDRQADHLGTTAVDHRDAAGFVDHQQHDAGDIEVALGAVAFQA